MAVDIGKLEADLAEACADCASHYQLADRVALAGERALNEDPSDAEAVIQAILNFYDSFDIPGIPNWIESLIKPRLRPTIEDLLRRLAEVLTGGGGSDPAPVPGES